MKIIIPIIFITLFSINLISDEIKKTDEKQIKSENQKTMTDDEFLKKFMEQEKRQEGVSLICAVSLELLE